VSTLIVCVLKSICNRNHVRLSLDNKRLLTNLLTYMYLSIKARTVIYCLICHLCRSLLCGRHNRPQCASCLSLCPSVCPSFSRKQKT